MATHPALHQRVVGRLRRRPPTTARRTRWASAVSACSTGWTGARTRAPTEQVYAELPEATRAVISGRRTYEHAGHWQGDHHDGVPIFVLTHEVPEDPLPGSVRYVTDVSECADQAGAAGGDAT